MTPASDARWTTSSEILLEFYFVRARRSVDNTDCLLTIDGCFQRLWTHEAGVLEASIAKAARHWSLTLSTPRLRDAEVSFQIGHLDPIDTESGSQGRLHNLGYLAAPSAETGSDELRSPWRNSSVTRA